MEYKTFTRCLILALSITLFLATVSAKTEFYKGDEITVESENMTLTFGKNYTLNTSIEELHVIDSSSSSVIPLAKGQNLSISSDTPEQVNAT
jgi:hypothetical protein